MMRRKALMTGAAAAVVLACSVSTSPGTASLVSGAWTYAGTQETPAPTTLEGSLNWQGVAGSDGAFEGTFTVLERLPTGATRTLSGPGAGQLIADSVADFDLTFEGVARRHIGVLRADSISGSWATLAAGHTASGQFVLRRRP